MHHQCILISSLALPLDNKDEDVETMELQFTSLNDMRCLRFHPDKKDAVALSKLFLIHNASSLIMVPSLVVSISKTFHKNLRLKVSYYVMNSATITVRELPQQ